MKRRLAVLALGSILSASTVHAQGTCPQFDGAKFDMIVGGAPGGGYDTYARSFAPLLEAATGGTVVVRNVEGAGGKIAQKAIAEAEPDGRTFGFLSAVSLVVPEPGDTAPGMTLADLTPLGSAYVDDMVWVARSDFELDPEGGEPIVLATHLLDQALVHSGLTAESLGIAYKIVPGYAGTTEFAAAAIRGEVDGFGVAAETAARLTRGGDLKLLFTLTDAPLEDGVPHLAGEDGLAAKFRSGAGAGAKEVEDAVRLAGSVATVSKQLRSFVISTAVPDGDRECLEGLFATLLGGEEYEAVMKEQKRSVTPMDADATLTLLKEIESRRSEVAPLVAKVIEQTR